MKDTIKLELTNHEADALLRLIAVANTQTLDTEPRDRLAGRWMANRLNGILSERKLKVSGSKADRIKRTMASLKSK